MSGQGSVQFTPHVDAPIPATVTALNNGLSLVGTTGQLGGVNPLIHNTTINMSVFNLVMSGFFFTFFESIQSSGQAVLGDQNFAAVTVSDMAANVSSVGDYFGNGNTSLLDIIDNFQLLRFRTNNDRYLEIDGAIQNCLFGDIDNVAGGTTLQVDATNNQVSFFENGASGNPFLQFDATQRLYTYGDMAPIAAGHVVSMSDQFGQFFFGLSSGLTRFLNLDTINDTYAIGDINASNLGNYILVDDANGNFDFMTGPTLRLRTRNGNLTIEAANGSLIETSTALADGVGANVGTLLNAPTAGNPAKWISIVDNGVTRFIPTWI